MSNTTEAVTELLPPLYLTLAVDRQTGLISTTNSAAPAQALEDCRLLLQAIEQIERALRERRIELEVAAAVAAKQSGDTEAET